MYKVIKKFYDPFEKRVIKPGEKIEIKEKYLPGYLPYVQKIEKKVTANAGRKNKAKSKTDD